jgi:hypothetical protein
VTRMGHHLAGSLVGRLTNWLGFILEEEVFWKDSTTAQHEARLRFLLSKLIDFGRANNVRPPSLTTQSLASSSSLPPVMGFFRASSLHWSAFSTATSSDGTAQTTARKSSVH